jgi:hypothetical protein
MAAGYQLHRRITVQDQHTQNDRPTDIVATFSPGTDEDAVARHTPLEQLPVLRRRFQYCFTSGPVALPAATHSLDWGLLNNDQLPQVVRVTVFKCHLGAPKTAEPPGPLEVTLNPGETTHNANSADGGFFYEIQVECNSQLVFPYMAAWPGGTGDPIPGSVVTASGFARM